MIRRYVSVVIILGLAILGAVPSAVQGEEGSYPQKTIRFIVPYAAGSGNDIQTRGLTPYVEKALGGRIIIENRPGADGRLGANEAWKSAPDGYTIFNAGMPTPIINEKLFSVNYKTREFTHIYSWSQDNICLVANAELYKSTEEFLAAARSRTLAAGITGIGSVSQITGLALAEVANFKPVNWVPFKGGSETMTNVAGKHVDFGITTTSSAKALVDAGKLRVILVFSQEKDNKFPQAPLPREHGLKVTAMPIVRGAMAPPGLSPRIAGILEQAFAKAVRNPDFLSWAKKARVTISPMNHEQFLNYTIDVEKEVNKHLSKVEIKK